MLRKIVFVLAAVFCLSPFCSSAVALILGAVLALTLGNPWNEITKSVTPKLLSASVVGLGAGMNLVTVAQVGASGIGYTLISIGLAFAVGLSLAKVLKIEENTGLLVTVGTAICGGSAIAAVSPVLRAKAHEMSVALGIVFLLNACALVIFPSIGHAFGLSESQFGLWSALAIHDTSSVVGASMQYGPHALEVGTTVKLARALWIVPVTFAFGLFVARYRPGGAGEAKPKKPWFILGFLIVAAVVTWVPELKGAGHGVETIARHALVLTLFLIGTNLTPATLKAVGFKPFLQGLGLWIVMAVSTLVAIAQGWIRV
jgi:uncharacterized integral membrane protein (TIGR00698 family)